MHKFWGIINHTSMHCTHTKMSSQRYTLASFPGCSHLQSLIACSVCILQGGGNGLGTRIPFHPTQFNIQMTDILQNGLEKLLPPLVTYRSVTIQFD